MMLQALCYLGLTLDWKWLSKMKSRFLSHHNSSDRVLKRKILFVEEKIGKQCEKGNFMMKLLRYSDRVEKGER